MVTNPLIIDPPGYVASNRHVWLELSVGAGDLERHLLPEDALEEGRHRRVRRAALLRGALRYRRGEFDVLRPASRRRHLGLGQPDPPGLRVFVEAVPEVHAPEDVPGGSVEDGSRDRGTAARPAGAGHPERHRRLPDRD